MIGDNMFKWLIKLFKREKKIANREAYMKQMVQIVHKYVEFFSSVHGAPESIVTKWGAWIKMAEGDNFKIKVILVEKEQRFSLQRHNNRDELWCVVSGEGKITVGKQESEATAGNYFYIPRGIKHRAECTGGEDLRFIEVQFGDCDESDIVRLEDDYGRV